MNSLAKFALLLITITCGSSNNSSAADRICIDAKINGKPIELIFDTGCSDFVIDSRVVKKHGLKLLPAATEEPLPGFVAGETGECELALLNSKVRTKFLVLKLPSYVDSYFDGLLGWWPVRHNLFQIDAVKARLSRLDKLPNDIETWGAFRIVGDSGSLDLQIPRHDQTNGVLCIDTGSSDSLELSPERWRTWRDSHTSTPLTLKTAYSPSDGFFVVQEAWADEIKIGDLTFKAIPISQSGPAAANSWGGQYDGTLGLHALSRFDFIVDGKNRTAYFRPSGRHVQPYSHNRIGAVFVPAEGHEQEAVARVIQGGPAYLAGVRDGDILLQVDSVKVESWSNTWISRFSRKAGTKLRLTLNRNDKIFTTTVVLREIVAPAANRKD